MSDESGGTGPQPGEAAARMQARVRWPQNHGAQPGSRLRYESIPALVNDYPEFQHLDRIGAESGVHLAVRGTAFEMRSVTPYHSEFEYHTYELTGILPAPIQPEISVVAPALGFPGGGWQILFVDTSRSLWVSVADLIDKYGVIR